MAYQGLIGHEYLKRIVYHLLQKETPDWNAVQSWLEKKSSLNAILQVADALVQQGKSEAALTSLAKVNLESLTDDQRKELQAFSELKQLLHQWLLAGKALNSLNAEEVKSLVTIADRWAGRGSTQAQSILNFWYGYRYAPGLSADGGGKSLQLATGSIAPAEQPLFSLFPNPTRNTLTVDYRLPKGDDRPAVLELTDLYGKVRQKLSLPAGGGKADIDVSDLAGGLYFATLYLDGELWKTLKVMKQ